VTSIGNGVFRGCSSLTNIEIPSSVTSIGDFAFSGCNSLIIIIVDESNPIYDSRDNCNGIILTADDSLIFGCKTTLIPNSVTSIGDYAFAGCSSLTSIIIPHSVTRIGKSAFDRCDSLTSIEIPSSVIYIEIYAFGSCENLTIYCRALSKPRGWNRDWNYYNYPVIWGYNG
jgi:hypothetical protein